MMGNAERAERYATLLAGLAERLASEQVNTGLLDAFARRLEAEPAPGIPLATVERFRREELHHVRLLERAIRLLERAIRLLGGSPGVPAPDRARSVAEGLQRVVQSSASELPAALEALYLAEVRDKLGWELLIQLSDGANLSWLSWEFRGALLEEREHAFTVRGWVEKCAESGPGVGKRAA